MIAIQRALLFGGTGFAGAQMAQLLAADYQVTAVGREVDIRDARAVARVVEKARPDVVVNFAAITTVRESFADPEATFDIALKGMLHVLTALKAGGFNARVLNVSSSEVYGHPAPAALPITEASPLTPMSPYSVAKLASEFLCQQWARSEGMQIMVARPFTHIGPGQSDRFAIASFGRQAAEIMLGLREPVLRTGDLSPTRDITDVRDTVRAYKAILEHGQPGEIYNVCSGSEVSMHDILDKMTAMVGRAVRLETAPSMLRKSEQQRLRGSHEKLVAATGWRPTFALHQTLDDTLQAWLKKLSPHHV